MKTLDKERAEERIASAFHADRSCIEKRAFTRERSVYLHSCLIFQRLKGEQAYFLSLGGWDTQMTRRYLNALLRPLDCSIFYKQKKHCLRVGEYQLALELDDVVFFRPGEEPRVLSRDDFVYKIFFPG